MNSDIVVYYNKKIAEKMTLQFDQAKEQEIEFIHKVKPAKHNGNATSKCYFAWDKHIQGWHEVLGFEKSQNGNLHIVVDGCSLRFFEEPVPCKTFGGVRDLDRVVTDDDKSLLLQD